MEDSKKIIQGLLRKSGKALYEQSVRVTKTYAKEISDNIVGIGRDDYLFEQIAQMQANLEIVKVGENIDEEKLKNRVNEILGIPKTTIKEPIKKVVNTTTKKPQQKKG